MAGRFSGFFRSQAEIDAEDERMEFPDDGRPNGIPSEIWAFDASLSQRAGAALVVGSYGKALQQDVELVRRALANELTEEEIAVLEAMRPAAEQERWQIRRRYLDNVG